MKITIEADEMDKDEELIKVYVRWALKMLNIRKIEVEKGK
jgi:hypothetical protein